LEAQAIEMKREQRRQQKQLRLRQQLEELQHERRQQEEANREDGDDDMDDDEEISLVLGLTSKEIANAGDAKGDDSWRADENRSNFSPQPRPKTAGPERRSRQDTMHMLAFTSVKLAPQVSFQFRDSVIKTDDKLRKILRSHDEILKERERYYLRILGFEIVCNASVCHVVFA
jgi:hypothetical protein